MRMRRDLQFELIQMRQRIATEIDRLSEPQNDVNKRNDSKTGIHFIHKNHIV